MSATAVHVAHAGLMCHLGTVIDDCIHQKETQCVLVLSAVAAIAVHVPCTIALVSWLGFSGAGWAILVMRTAHLGFMGGKMFRFPLLDGF